VLYIAPLSILLLERLWMPLEYGNITGYLDVEETATSRTSKLPFLDLKKFPPLEKLTGSYSWKMMCPAKTELLADVHAPVSQSLSERRIPKIIHQTARSRCVTPAFATITNKWKFPGWSYYFHDDDALDRLLHMDFPEFPHLRVILRNCVTNGTLKADLWRYLVLWVYGGVYADFDSAPNEFSADTIDPTDDGWFVVEQYHILSQWFMAVSPRHPLMYYAIHHSLLNLLEAEDTQQIGAHLKTGPHALHRAFMDFRKDAGILVDPLGTGFKPVWSGRFAGTHNRTITVVGVGENENEFVQRLAVDPIVRQKAYRAMGMTHFSKYTKPNAKKSGHTCLDAMLNDVTAAIDS
jgi:mannosyltransferase OCH1-like enzyme